MPRSKPDHDFDIYVDSSCLNTPMDEETISLTGDTKFEAQRDDEELDTSMPAESSDKKSKAKYHNPTVEMTNDTEQEAEQQELRPSIETDGDAGVTQKEVVGTRTSSRTSSRRLSKRGGKPIDSQPEHDISAKDEETEGNSILSDRTDHSFHLDDGDQSYVDRSELGADNAALRGTDGDENSSQHEGTDEDVFTDKSSRSSMGSYDASSDCGKGVDPDGTTIITRSPRISDISQYDKEDFVPTARGTPRPPFRTPSDVRAMQMSSPAGSVLGSPRSSRKHFPTGSRLGTPSASAQYSPKRRSTPPRFKSHLEAPLVLLHVTLLPLRWMWGDLVNNLDPVEMSEQAKTLRNSWRILQDRVGDTVIERGILLGHPQNDYEVLEERVLEALELPVRRRARILECGHYLGPSNETTITEEEEESEDEYSQHRRQSASKRHWCATCKSEIPYDALGEAKIFRVKVYASNGLMRAGAWEACWKEMERVDVELEPIVEPTVQDEIVRLAAVQQEREIAQQEEADIAKEVALQYEEQRRSEEHILLQQEKARLQSSSPPAPEVIPEAIHEHIHESRSPRRRHRDEERLREIYGETPPPPESHSREPSSHHHPDPYVPTPPPQSPEKEEVHEQKENRRHGYQSASLSELLMQSARVLMQDRKNVVIFTLGLFVLILSLRSTPPEPTYEPVIYRLKNMPEMQQQSTIDTLPAVPEQQRPVEAHDMESIVATPSFEISYNEPSQANSIYQEASPSYESPHNEPSQSNSEYQEVSSIIEQQPVISVASQAVSQPTQDSLTTPTSVATVYEPCGNPTSRVLSENTEVSSAISDAPTVEEPTQEIVEETVHETVEEIEITMEKKLVKIVQTVTRTQTQTQTETQTEVEMATAVETIIVKATEAPQLETLPNVEEKTLDLQDDAALVEDGLPNDEIAEIDPEVDSVPEIMPKDLLEDVLKHFLEDVLEDVPKDMPEAVPETKPESLLESVAEPTVEPEVLLDV
ncbi:hypothetical protein F4782DRAFT_491005 [Xylaria castorea]|nr:hypothetical protein F4782DRAFT_491005 [Xylaria castorea]